MKNLDRIAAEIHAVDIQKRLECVKNLQERSGLHVGIIGEANSGKTTLLNGILKQEIREPSVLPTQGKPLRVCFDRSPNDARFDCVHVFNDEWGNQNVTFYEITSDTLMKDVALKDELDFVFYLSPITHFLTSFDRKTLASLSVLPVQIVATRCDEIRADEMERTAGLVGDACRRYGLKAPVFSGSADWSSVSTQMRDLLPLSMEVAEHRKRHQAAIEADCVEALLTAINEMIEAEQKKQEWDQEDLALRRHEERMAELARQNALQQIRLDCEDSCNASVGMVRDSIKRLDVYSGKLVENVKAGKVNDDFRRETSAEANMVYAKELQHILEKVNSELQRIESSAISQHFLTSGEALAAYDHASLAEFVNGRKAIDFSSKSGNEIPKILESVAGAGVMTVGAALLHVPPLAVTLVAAASSALGYGCYQVRDRVEIITKNASEIAEWARKATDEMQNLLIPQIRKAYENLGRALHMPETVRQSANETPKTNETIQMLNALADELK